MAAPTRRPDDWTGRLPDLPAVFAGLPQRRLVLVGEAGAGKSALGLHLARELLACRTPGAAVPVLLNLSSWDDGEPDARQLGQLVSPIGLRGHDPAAGLVPVGVPAALAYLLCGTGRDVIPRRVETSVRPAEPPRPRCGCRPGRAA